MKYKKVLVVSNMYPSKDFPSYGVFVKNFCKQLSEIGVHYNICVLTKTSNRLKKMMKYLFFYIKTFCKSLFGGYDLVYIHYPSLSAKPVLIARMLRKFEIITNVHGTDVVPLKIEHEKMLVVTKDAISKSEVVVVPSEYYKELVKEKFEISKEKIVVYPSAGVNEKVFHRYESQKKKKLFEEFGIAHNSLVIGFVSRINKAKGWDIFIDALEKCEVFKKSKVTVFIVGSGEDDHEIEVRINSLPEYLKSSIRRYPLLPQEKLADIYNMLDVFIFPTTSASESLGLVAIEALACGCPVIASDYAAPKYYIKDGENGFKFIKSDSIDLAQKVDGFFSLQDNQREKLVSGALLTGSAYNHKYIASKLNEIFWT